MKSLSNYVHLSSLGEAWTGGQLILIYHSVDVPPLFHNWRGLYVSPQLLARQLRELQAAGAEFCGVEKWNDPDRGARRVVVSFDDAIRNLFVKGLPVLQKLGVPAITYVVADRIGKWNAWDDGKGLRREPLMDRDELDEWLRCGHEIGSHTLTHPALATLPIEEARREIIDSKKTLEDLFGRPVRHFCYPYGSFNEAIRGLVKEAGYETATGIDPGFNMPDSDAFDLRRISASHGRPWLAAFTNGLI